MVGPAPRPQAAALFRGGWGHVGEATALGPDERQRVSHESYHVLQRRELLRAAHTYFCGADEPYDNLKKVLRAEIDEAEWSKLCATTSLPFTPPAKGKIAVKVINHYGDEVLKVFGAP